jgi:hypothetical protein
VLGGLILFLGLGFLVEWVLDARSRMVTTLRLMPTSPRCFGEGWTSVGGVRMCPEHLSGGNSPPSA